MDTLTQSVRSEGFASADLSVNMRAPNQESVSYMAVFVVNTTACKLNCVANCEGTTFRGADNLNNRRGISRLIYGDYNGVDIHCTFRVGGGKCNLMDTLTQSVRSEGFASADCPST